MGATAIQVRGLGKEYQLGTRERGYTTLREAVTRFAAAPLRRLKKLAGKGDPDSSFWALREVSFDVQPGEVVGIIGRNGAGKSTLLKVLSRIVEPTTGEVVLNGRVGSLLEVGTGFHPELTGRENVYLNGAILGMSRKEVARKFDEIVAFSEVEKFLDTPVKKYSSGMYTRLAFAVAAHLEPEILIVDEVLAVGDAAFQQKCIGKMSEVAKGGRTVLFVSHNMAAVEAMCDRGVLLDGGQVVVDGTSEEAIQRYLNTGGVAAGEYVGSPVSGRAYIHSVRVDGEALTDAGASFPVGAPLTFTIECRAPRPVHSPAIGLGIENKRGVRVVTLHTKCAAGELANVVEGTQVFTCRVPRLPLVPGEYTVKVAFEGGGEMIDYLEQAFTFSIHPSDFFNNAGKFVGGLVFAEQEWGTQPAGDPSCGR